MSTGREIDKYISRFEFKNLRNHSIERIMYRIFQWPKTKLWVILMAVTQEIKLSSCLKELMYESVSDYNVEGHLPITTYTTTMRKVEENCKDSRVILIRERPKTWREASEKIITTFWWDLETNGIKEIIKNVGTRWEWTVGDKRWPWT